LTFIFVVFYNNLILHEDNNNFPYRDIYIQMKSCDSNLDELML